MMINTIIKTTLRSFTVENLNAKDRETHLLIPGAKVIVILKLIDSLFKINPFYPLRDARHYFVRNGTSPFCNLLDRQFASEDDHFITLIYTRNASDVYHCHVHANRTNNRDQLVIDQHLPDTITEQS